MAESDGRQKTGKGDAALDNMPIDFLIVGGGIGVAVLANLLGRRGKRVVVPLGLSAVKAAQFWASSPVGRGLSIESLRERYV